MAGQGRRATLSERMHRALLRRIDRVSDRLRGVSQDPEKNGEARLIRTLAMVRPEVVFDVGANVGDWSALARRHFPDACIHTFEVASETAAQIAERLGPEGFVHNAFGLSDIDGEVSLKYYGDLSVLTTTLERSRFWDATFETRTATGRVRRGDDYCVEAGIDRIDLLKIDVEGVEHMVLRGFERMLRKGGIRCVQFEYGYANGDVHFLMRDFHEMFEGYGYVVGRVGPLGLELGEWTYAQNDFRSGPNYAALRADDTALIEALAAPG